MRDKIANVIGLRRHPPRPVYVTRSGRILPGCLGWIILALIAAMACLRSKLLRGACWIMRKTTLLSCDGQDAAYGTSGSTRWDLAWKGRPTLHGCCHRPDLLSSQSSIRAG